MLRTWYAACTAMRNPPRGCCGVRDCQNDYTGDRIMWTRWLALCFVVACGGARPPVAETSPTTHVGPTGLRVMMLPRPTPNVVRVSLWIDAGTRDADPPQLATLSAWVAASAAGGEVNARVLPDGTELSIECDVNEVDAAVSKLAVSLSARSTDADTLQALQERLTTERARHELDPRHVAEVSALVAAVGEDTANALLPLGRPADDASVTVERVARFLGDHFGPNRALVVAVGDTHADVVDHAVATHLAIVPAAGAARANRSLALAEGAAVGRVGRATQSHAATAIVSRDREAVAAALDVVARQWSRLSPDARWLPVRGGAVAMVVAASDDPIDSVHDAVRALSQARSEQASLQERVLEDLAAVSERAGLEFSAPASADEPTATVTRIGYGVTLADAARTGPEDEARADTRVRDAQAEMVATIERAARTPTLRGAVGTDAAHVVLVNGARIAVQRRASHNVGIAIRFLGGASEEHRVSHGRTAVLALLSAQACEGLAAGALFTRLNALGATLTPTLDPDSFGLRLSAPSTHWQASLDLLMRCALAPSLNRRVLRDAQARMLATLAEDGAHGHAALVAERLAATHPGTIAPWGGSGSVLLDLDSIARAHAQSAVGSRIALTIVGDVAVDVAVATAARRLSSLPTGALPLTPEHDAEPPNVGALPTATESPRAVLMFHVAGPGTDEVIARGFAALVAEELTRTPSIALRWVDAGAWAQGAWAAIAIELPIETLEQLQVTVERARATLATESGRARAAALMQHAARQAARILSEPLHEADLQARRMLDGNVSVSARGQDAVAFDAFLRTQPHYLVSRGRTPPAPAQASESRP